MGPIYSDEIYHFGIKGMKWGWRRSNKNNNTTKVKTNYGISKNQVKKSIEKSKDIETNKIRSQYQNELHSQFKSAGKDIDRAQRSAIARQVGKKYVDKFNDALLKDINQSHIENGKQMLKDYKLGFKVDKDYGVVRKTNLGTKIYA